MRISIIGAGGFVGRALQEYLQGMGDEVTGFDMPLPGGRACWKPLDVLRDAIDIPKGTEAVYYLAQSPHYRIFPQEAGHLWGVNVWGVIRAAEAAAASGVRFFCFASSGNVYAPSFEPLTEEHPSRHDDPYALTKLHAEESLALFQARMTVTCVRFFGVFGPGQNKMLPVVLAQRVRDGQPITLAPRPGEVENPCGLRVSFLYIADAISILRRLSSATLKENKAPLILNVAGPDPISIRDFAGEIGRCLGRSPSFCRDRDPRTFDLVADISRLKAILSPAFTPFSKAVSLTVASHP